MGYGKLRVNIGRWHGWLVKIIAVVLENFDNSNICAFLTCPSFISSFVRWTLIQLAWCRPHLWPPTSHCYTPAWYLMRRTHFMSFIVLRFVHVDSYGPYLRLPCGSSLGSIIMILWWWEPQGEMDLKLQIQGAWATITSKLLLREEFEQRRSPWRPCSMFSFTPGTSPTHTICASSRTTCTITITACSCGHGSPCFARGSSD